MVIGALAEVGGEGMKDVFKCNTWVVGFVAQLSQMGEAPGGVSLVAGNEDGLNVGEVLVKRGAADPGLLGDLRHRHGAQSVLIDQGHRRIQDSVGDLSAVRLDGLSPDPGHDISLHSGDISYDVS